MGKNDRCVIGCCDNDKRYKEKMVKHSNVHGEIVMHKLPVDPEVRAEWLRQIMKGRQDITLQNFPKNCYVCSIHFLEGKPTKENPAPTLF